MFRPKGRMRIVGSLELLILQDLHASKTESNFEVISISGIKVLTDPQILDLFFRTLSETFRS